MSDKTPVQLLVSVRNAREALAALHGGADIIDIKEPSRGALGRADWDEISRIVDVVRRHDPSRLVSAAMGEIAEWDAAGIPSSATSFPDLFKAGPAGVSRATPDAHWSLRWQSMRNDFAGRSSRWVVVAYADYERCHAPAPADMLSTGSQFNSPVLLLDTFDKDDTTLLDWIADSDLRELREGTRRRNMKLALAGRIDAAILDRVLAVEPDIIAVRGAACDAGDRRATVTEDRVRQLAKRLSLSSTARH